MTTPNTQAVEAAEREKFEALLPSSMSRRGATDQDGEFSYNEDWVQGAWVMWNTLTSQQEEMEEDDLASLREADAMLCEIGVMCRAQTMFVGSYAEIVRQALDASQQEVAGGVEVVTRESALRAISHVGLYNGHGREREAADMLVPATQAQPPAVVGSGGVPGASVAAPVGISRSEWIAQAKAFYVESGDDDATARECARYICNQQDWAGGEIGDPREEAQEDIHGRGRTGLAVLATSRVPVASPAEPVPKLAGSPFESYVAQVIHAAFADGWGSCRDAEFAGDEAMNDAFNQSATLGVCLSIDGAGGAGVMDARPDSFHSDSGECDRVQRVELSGDELALFQQTLEDFADCGETETDYEVLVNWAQRGLLECINFQPTAAAHRMLSSITSTDQKGNAA